MFKLGHLYFQAGIWSLVAVALVAGTCVQNVLSRSMFQGPSSRVGRSDLWRGEEDDFNANARGLTLSVFHKILK